MKSRWPRRTGVALVAVLLTSGVTGAEGPKWGDTGRVSAVTVSSRTIVVEIPRGKDSLTVGAEVPPDAVLQVEGRKIELSDIQVGDRVRMEWSHTEHGDVAHRVLVLEGAKR